MDIEELSGEVYSKGTLVVFKKESVYKDVYAQTNDPVLAKEVSEELT